MKINFPDVSLDSILTPLCRKSREIVGYVLQTVHIPTQLLSSHLLTIEDYLASGEEVR